MKKILVGAIGAVALSMSAPASAADMAARPYTKAPPMVAPIYDWTGFYIGANGGRGHSRNCWAAPGQTAVSDGVENDQQFAQRVLHGAAACRHGTLL